MVVMHYVQVTVKHGDVTRERFGEFKPRASGTLRNVAKISASIKQPTARGAQPPLTKSSPSIVSMKSSLPPASEKSTITSGLMKSSIYSASSKLPSTSAVAKNGVLLSFSKSSESSTSTKRSVVLHSESN